MKRLILVTVIVFIDQFSKYLIKSNYFIYESKSIIGNLVRFTYIENPGLAFGLSVGKLKWLLFVITLLIAMYIFYVYITQKYENIRINSRLKYYYLYLVYTFFVIVWSFIYMQSIFAPLVGIPRILLMLLLCNIFYWKLKNEMEYALILN